MICFYSLLLLLLHLIIINDAYLFHSIAPTLAFGIVNGIWHNFRRSWRSRHLAQSLAKKKAEKVIFGENTVLPVGLL